MKAFIQQIAAFLKNNNIKSIGNLALFVLFLVFLHKHVIAGIFFGFFLANNSAFFSSMWDKFVGIFKKKEAEVVASVEAGVKAEETKVVDAVKAEETKIVDDVKKKL